MQKSVTIKDIAKAAGVSHTTVSRALSNHPRISGETKARIWAICKEMHYTKNYAARSLVLSKSALLGVVLPTFSNPFMSELAQEIEKSAYRHGYGVVIANSDENTEKEEKALQHLCGHQVDGAIIFPTDTSRLASLEPRYAPRMPLLFLNDPPEGSPGSYVSVDNYNGGMLGVHYLYELGHRHILYFSQPPVRNSHIRREMGYTAACRELGLPPRLYYAEPSMQEHMRQGIDPADDFKAGREMARALFGRNAHLPCSAIFARSDLLALGLLAAADEYGIRIPQDISLLGYDDISYAALPRIDLSTIRQPIERMAEAGVNGLLGRINGQSEDCFRQRFEPQLIKRKTCRPLSC